MSAIQITAQTTQRRRILVVDDKRLVRWSVCETLTDRGYTVLALERGAFKALHKPFEMQQVTSLVA